MINSPDVEAGDLEGLPKELLDSLEIPDSKKMEMLIIKCVDSVGGSASINKILISLYRDTGEIHGRKETANRVYRMTQKGLLFSSSLGKGIYTTANPNK